MNLCVIFIGFINIISIFAMINLDQNGYDRSLKSPYLSSVYDAMKNNIQFTPDTSAQSMMNLNQGFTVDNRYKRNISPAGRSDYFPESRFTTKLEEEYISLLLR